MYYIECKHHNDDTSSPLDAYNRQQAPATALAAMHQARQWSFAQQVAPSASCSSDNCHTTWHAPAARACPPPLVLSTLALPIGCIRCRLCCLFQSYGSEDCWRRCTLPPLHHHHSCWRCCSFSCSCWCCVCCLGRSPMTVPSPASRSRASNTRGT